MLVELDSEIAQIFQQSTSVSVSKGNSAMLMKMSAKRRRTKQEIMEIANRAIHAIEDYHHIFIEGLRFEERRGDVLVFDLVTGS